MSGHSKWAQIKRKKGVTDQKRAQIFTKLSRMITLAVSEGGGSANPEINIRLRLAIAQAKVANMPRNTVERAIAKATSIGKDMLVSGVYEAYGPGASALIISFASSNTNRTFSELRTILDRGGGKMAGKGAVSYMFEKCIQIYYKGANGLDNLVLNRAQELNAITYDEAGGGVVMHIPFELMGKTQEDEEALLVYRPIVTVEVLDAQQWEDLEVLIERLSQHDDVQDVFTNALFVPQK